MFLQQSHITFSEGLSALTTRIIQKVIQMSWFQSQVYNKEILDEYLR